MLMVKRAPLWTYPTKSVPAEKSQRKKAGQHPHQKKIFVGNLNEQELIT